MVILEFGFHPILKLAAHAERASNKLNLLKLYSSLANLRVSNIGHYQGREKKLLVTVLWSFAISENLVQKLKDPCWEVIPNSYQWQIAWEVFEHMRYVAF